jgi:hypothetical protein
VRSFGTLKFGCAQTQGFQFLNKLFLCFIGDSHFSPWRISSKGSPFPGSKLASFIYLVSLHLQFVQLFLGKQPPSPPIPMLGFIEGAFFEPTKESGPADTD